jgi:hypothetical protein
MKRPHRTPHRGLLAFRSLIGAVGLTLAHAVHATSDFQPCSAEDGGYSSRVYELMRAAHDAPIEPLIFMGTSMIQRSEIGIGLARRGRRQYLIRMEFDPSLHTASTVQIAPNTYTNNFADAKVHVLVTTVPVSDALASAFKNTLNELEGERKVAPTMVTQDGAVLEEIMLDSFTHQMTLDGGRCVELAMRYETLGLKTVRLNYFLARGLQAWTREGSAEFETEALSLLSEIRNLIRTQK